MGLLDFTRIGRPAYLLAVAFALVAAGPAAAQTSVKFSLDGRLEGPEALVLLPQDKGHFKTCLLYTSPSPRDRQKSRMPSSA